MNWNEIGRQLRLMQAIVDEAQHAEKMSDLERDLLLETLRKCYTEIKFGTAEVVKEEMAEVVAPAAMVAAVVAEKEIEEEVVVEPEVEAEPEIEVEPEPEVEPELEVEPEPTSEPEPTPEPEEVFTSVRHKLDRKTIRSLYFDDAPAESAQEVDKEFYAPVKEETPQEEPAPAEEPMPATEPAISFEITEEEPAEEKVVYIADDEEEEPETPASIFEITDEEPEEESAELPFSFREAEESAEAVKEVAEERVEAVKAVAEERAEEVATTIADAVQPVTVLGDVMGAERTTIADSIAPSEDVASVIGGRQLSSLRGAIGLNDKFLLIRDLFGGDNSAYEAAIDGLDGCDNLDDAMLYIFDNIEWNGESDGAQLLTELLSRRFQ